MKNLLRRTRFARTQETPVSRIGAWSFDATRRRLVHEDGRRVSLTRGEYELLAALVCHPGVVMNRERLLGVISHRGHAPSDRTIDVLIRRLRQKIETDPRAPDHIITAHGEGYLLASDTL